VLSAKKRPLVIAGRRNKGLIALLTAFLVGKHRNLELMLKMHGFILQESFFSLASTGMHIFLSVDHLASGGTNRE